MGSSCMNINNNIETKNLIINLYSCTKGIHNSLEFKSNNKSKNIEVNNEIITTKLQTTQFNESIKNNQKKNVSEQTLILPSQGINEDLYYKIELIKQCNEENNILNKLYNVFKQKENYNNNKSVIINYINGEKYIGELDKNNIKNGRGIQIFNNYNVYYGYWEGNKMNGLGKMIKPNQKIDDLNLIFDDILIPFYYGEWKNDLEDGKGEEIWKDNSIYKGEYKEGFKQGIGELLLSDGTQYWGEFSHGKIEGKGKIKYKDGREYEGNWINNKMNGEGTFSWPDGRIYKGNYINNFKNGYGEFIWPNGKKYKGMWANGKQNGKGQLYIKDYDFWISGIWKDGKRLKEKNG